MDIPIKEVEHIRGIIEEKEMFDDEEIDGLKLMKVSSGTNSIVLATLFLKCYDYLNDFYNNLENSEKEDIVKFKELIRDFDVIYLRSLLEEYSNGNDFGSYFTGEKIKNVVRKDREKMNCLIAVFFLLFSVEE